MAEARKLTNAERCSLFLLDTEQQDLVAKVFDGVVTGEVRLFYDSFLIYIFKSRGNSFFSYGFILFFFISTFYFVMVYNLISKIQFYFQYFFLSFHFPLNFILFL